MIPIFTKNTRAADFKSKVIGRENHKKAMKRSRKIPKISRNRSIFAPFINKSVTNRRKSDVFRAKYVTIWSRKYIIRAEKQRFARVNYICSSWFYFISTYFSKRCSAATKSTLKSVLKRSASLPLNTTPLFRNLAWFDDQLSQKAFKVKRTRARSVANRSRRLKNHARGFVHKSRFGLFCIENPLAVTKNTPNRGCFWNCFSPNSFRVGIRSRDATPFEVGNPKKTGTGAFLGAQRYVL